MLNAILTGPPRGGALMTSPTPGVPRLLLPVLLVFLSGALDQCPRSTVAVAARKVPAVGTGTSSNVYLDSHVTNERGFDACKHHALEGHCEFYSCLDQSLQCAGSKHNRSVAFRFCQKSRHHSGDFSHKGRRWARETNACVLKAVASSGRRVRRQQWCSRVDSVTKQALVDCARATEICHVLWTDRDVLHDVFSTSSWLTVVEAAKHCPRATVNRYIFWTLSQMHVYKR